MPTPPNNRQKNTTGVRHKHLHEKHERLGYTTERLLELLEKFGSYARVSRITKLSPTYLREVLGPLGANKYLKKRQNVLNTYLDELPVGADISAEELAKTCSMHKRSASDAIKRNKLRWEERANQIVRQYMLRRKPIVTIGGIEVAPWGVDHFEIEKGWYRDVFLVRLHMKNDRSYTAKFLFTKKNAKRSKEDGTSASQRETPVQRTGERNQGNMSISSASSRSIGPFSE